MTHIATLYSHYGAIHFKKICHGQGIPAKIMPVPRNLSSSCGSCVVYQGENPFPIAPLPQEVEQIVQVTEDGYISRYLAENS